MNIEKVQRTEKEYRALKNLSASDLRLFASDRKKFYKEKVLLEPREEEYNRATLIGSLVHCLLLEPQEFDSRYFLSSLEGMPTGLMLSFTEALYKHTIANSDEYGTITCEFSELCRLAYEESGFKQTIDTVLKKFVGSTAEDYYQQLRESKAKGLQVVTVADINIAQKIVDLARNHPYTSYILNQENDSTHAVFNELQIENFDLLGIKMKSMLDKVIVNHDDKTISIYDLKVVYSVNEFYREYYLKKLAYIQGFVYHQAAMEYFGKEYKDYLVFAPTFVVIDSGCFYAPIKYSMNEKHLSEALDGFVINDREYKGVQEIIENIQNCLETGIWNTTAELIASNGFVEIS